MQRPCTFRGCSRLNSRGLYSGTTKDLIQAHTTNDSKRQLPHLVLYTSPPLPGAYDNIKTHIRWQTQLSKA
jgi:hypothetical protein